MNCPICNTESIFVFTSKHLRDIYYCTNNICEHFFTPQFENNQGVILRDKDIEANSDKDLSIYSERNERLLKLFLKFINYQSYPINFLDYGAGTAHVSRSFKKNLGNKVNIFCLEANKACQALYNKYGLIQIETLKQLKKKLNFIYMIEVIEHLVDPIDHMKELRKYLNLNGSIFLSTPLGTMKESETHAYNTSSHLHFFSKKSFNLMLKKSGFMEIDFKFYTEMYPVPLNKYQKFRLVVKGLINNSFLEHFINNKHIVGFTRPIDY